MTMNEERRAFAFAWDYQRTTTDKRSERYLQTKYIDRRKIQYPSTEKLIRNADARG